MFFEDIIKIIDIKATKMNSAPNKGVSQKVLTENLKNLEEEDIIEKIVYPQIPLKVEYMLTEKGKELSNILKELEFWSKKHYEKCVEV